MSQKYKCGICESKPDQLSHHKMHIDTQKHKDKRTIFELKLKQLSTEDLEKDYKTHNIEDILGGFETKKTIVLKKLIKPQITIISNKEALKDKIHDIHNYIRNNGGGYGMNALKLFNIIYGLKKIEENNLIDQSKLERPCCEFSNLLKMATENKNEELVEIIQDKVLDSLAKSSIREILFYEIPKNISGSVFSYLIKEIEHISEIEKATNTQLCGKIYEYFIGRDQSAISELGAYFTDRHITEFIYNEEPVIVNDNFQVPTMCDPFGGSGGFTVGYIVYLKNKYPKIDWKTEIGKVHHYDMNEDVIKSAALEFFCLSGNIPDMSTLRYANSFTDDFNNIKFDRIFTNPPYGGDGSKKTQKQSKRDKVKKYINDSLKTELNEETIKHRKKQLKNIEEDEKSERKLKEQSKVTLVKSSSRIQAFANKYKLKANDKEGVSLIQLMDLVEVGGTVVGVLKEGVFFNRTYKGLRECLIKNFNVRKVISIPSDQFENTSTKTSVLVFDNTEEKTSVVEFSELTVSKFSEDKFDEIDGQIVCSDYAGEGSKLKPDIKSVDKTVVSVATADEILANDIISFNGKDYIKDEIVEGEGYELKRLGDITEFLPSGNRLATFKDDNGDINYYTCSSTIKKCTIADLTKLSIIIGHSGNGCLFIDNNYSTLCTNHILFNKNKCILKYIYYYLTYKWNNFFTICYKGSTVKNTSNKSIEMYKIPIPKSPEKIQYWVDKISTPFNEKNEKQNLLENLEKEVLERVKYISDNEECDNLTLKQIFKKINTGINKPPDNKKGKLYPYYGTSKISGYTDHYLYDGTYILIARNGTMGNAFIVKGRFYPSDHIFICEVNNNYNINYIFKLLNINSFKIEQSSNGSTIKGISKENLEKIKISVPKNKNLITELEPKFAEIEQLKLDIQNAETRFDQYIKELGEEALKK
uniref:site-specific DNA-methyltransferase (adenine-specific) n=1 Tax=viral metagenome TaxID=1070528 RepID=A0A6C0EI08_9ZZZZ